jgi:SAM-dependent methyltransferase
VKSYDEFAQYYDADFGDYRDDIFLYREMARRTGDPILELMCGSGRALVPLVEEGYYVTGVDSSSVMLDGARQQLEDINRLHQATLIKGDVRTVELPAEHFALVFVAVNSFMHLLRVKDQLAALDTIYHTLAPHGLLIIDLFNPDPLQMVHDDNRLVLERRYHLHGREVFKFVATNTDMAAQVNDVSCFYDEVDEDGHTQRRVMRFKMRWLYRYELEHLLVRAGFMVKALYGSYELDAYTSSSERLIVVAGLR